MEGKVKTTKAAVAVLILWALCGAARAADGNDPMAHWMLDECEGTIAYDSAGSRDGTVYGAQWTTGQIGGALSFDGLDDYVALPGNNPVWLPEYDFTVSAWVYCQRDAASATEYLLDLNHANSSDPGNELGYGIFRGASLGELGFHMTTITNKDEDLYTDDVLSKGRWYHIVAVRDGTTQAIYLDGQFNISRTCSPDPIDFVGGYDDDRVNIGVFSRAGGLPSAFPFNGVIDDVRIYDRALTADEIRELYEWGLCGEEHPCMYVWPGILEFYAEQAGPNPQEQSFTIRNIGAGLLNYQIMQDCSWVGVDPNTGSSTAEPNEAAVSVDISGLAWGVHDCNLTISDPCACNDPQTVEVRLQVFAEGATDFGDCPPGYPTLLSDDGARHRIDPNLFLGSLVDEEADGQPSDDANGDDANYLPDEDGVFLLSSIVPEVGLADVEIVASANGLLDAWVDFNIDGDWSDPCEQIFASLALYGGSNLLSFNVPADANLGWTYARFRFSTAGGLDPNGPATDGEVEDYLVLIEECFPIDDPEYNRWVLQGRPRAWCCPYHSWGDANGDGWIGILDVLLLRPPHYNVGYGDANYDCRADFNHDGWVNILDVLIVRPPNYNVGVPGTCQVDWKDDCGPNP